MTYDPEMIARWAIPVGGGEQEKVQTGGLTLPPGDPSLTAPSQPRLAPVSQEGVEDDG